MKNVYFLSDAHLGSRAIEHGRTQERRLVNFLDSIKHKASAVYLLGDMFDFWYEFRTVVPKGYTRFLGKLSELTDLGVEVHFFTGNHDLWCGDYLTKECGVIIHREPLTAEIFGKEFYLAHGDGLGDPDKKFKMLRAMFRSRTLQTLFSALHPRWSMELGLNWAKHSRLKRIHGRKQRIPGALHQGIPEKPSQHQLLHLRPPPHRAGPDAEQYRPYTHPRRLDKLFLVCRL